MAKVATSGGAGLDGLLICKGEAGDGGGCDGLVGLVWSSFE